MQTAISPKTDANRVIYGHQRQEYWHEVARSPETKGWNKYYHKRLAEIYQFLIAPGQKIVEVGCGRGDLLAALKPGVGVGIDIAGEMVRCAAERHPELRFIQADAHEIELNETFDVIILSDLINELWDVQAVFQQLSKLARPSTRLVLNFYSRLWEVPLGLVRRLRLARPTLHQNWLAVEDVLGLLRLCDFEVIHHREEVLCPVEIPLVASVANRYLVRFCPFKYLAVTNFIVGQSRIVEPTVGRRPIVSVIVPARNEAGNIAEIFERTPEMGSKTELIFVEGHSTDATLNEIEAEMTRNPNKLCRLLRQKETGKGDAVRTGFANARGDILIILDADLTVPPEVLPRFLEVLCSGKGEFASGVRLVYPMEKHAMRFFNLLGNKFFSVAFSWLLGQPIKDTLCGTKVLWKSDYQRIAANRHYFGDFDPFGDFDLLFGAAKLNLRIVEIPIRYRNRKYGKTNIRRWSHGWLLLKMAFFAARKIKFV